MGYGFKKKGGAGQKGKLGVCYWCGRGLGCISTFVSTRLSWVTGLSSPARRFPLARSLACWLACDPVQLCAAISARAHPSAPAPPSRRALRALDRFYSRLARPATKRGWGGKKRAHKRHSSLAASRPLASAS